MINSKQRAKLRGMANSLETILQVGKGGVNEALIAQADEALKARELIKGRVLENAPAFAKEAAIEIAEKTNSDVVQIIGTRFVLFRRNHENPKIDLK